MNKTNYIVEPYKVFKHTKEKLDAMPCNLLKRLYLKSIYNQTANLLLTKNPNDVTGNKCKAWVEELDKEIFAGIKGVRLPLFIESY